MSPVVIQRGIDMEYCSVLNGTGISVLVHNVQCNTLLKIIIIFFFYHSILGIRFETEG